MYDKIFLYYSKWLKLIEQNTLYVTPLSIPASHGYRLMVLFVIQLQFGKHNSKPEIPTNQSGDGSSFKWKVS